MSTLWTPAVERNRRVQGWYDAAQARTITDRFTAHEFEQWHDLSGRGTTLVPTYTWGRPSHGEYRINQMPVTSYWHSDADHLRPIGDPAGDFYGVASTGFAMFAVFRARVWLLGGGSDGSGTYIWDRHGVGTGNPLCSLKGDSATGKWGFQIRNDGGGGLQNVPVTTITANKVELYSCTYNTTDGFRTYAQGAFTSSVAQIGTISLNCIRFGYGAATGSVSDADVAEWVIVTDPTDARLRQRIEGYLAHKWDVALAHDHPYAARPPLTSASRVRVWPPTAAPQPMAASLFAADGVRARTLTSGASFAVRLG